MQLVQQFRGTCGITLSVFCYVCILITHTMSHHTLCTHLTCTNTTWLPVTSWLANKSHVTYNGRMDRGKIQDISENYLPNSKFVNCKSYPMSQTFETAFEPAVWSFWNVNLKSWSYFVISIEIYISHVKIWHCALGGGLKKLTFYKAFKSA